MDQIYPQAPIPVSAIDNNTVMNEWSKFPINKAESFPPGVYEFNKTFRKNQAEYFAMSLERQEDSVYAVTFTDSLSDNKKRIGNWQVSFIVNSCQADPASPGRSAPQ